MTQPPHGFGLIYVYCTITCPYFPRYRCQVTYVSSNNIQFDPYGAMFIRVNVNLNISNQNRSQMCLKI